jgi:putative transposase
MSRKPRIHYPGAFYHVINRGNQRLCIFWDEVDFQVMLESLEKASRRYGWLVHAYCLMPNHFHLLVQVNEHPLWLPMRSLETSYARHHNRRHRKTGHVFQARYRATLCDKERYLLELVRYLHLNPVRARLVEKSEDWPWSSHCVYIGMIKNDWLYQSEVLGMFGRMGAGKLVDFLNQVQDTKRHPEYYRPESFPVLGESKLGIQIPPQQEPRRKGSDFYPGHRLSLEALASGLALANHVGVQELQGRSEQRRLVQIRDQLVYAALHYFLYPTVQVARFLHRSPAAISMSHRRIHQRLEKQPADEDELRRLLLNI